MAVFKNPRGRWVAQAYDPASKRPKQIGTFDTMRQADKAFRDHLRERELTAGETDLTIAEWRERWLNTPAWKASTRAHNADRSRAFVEEHGSTRLDAFTPGAAKRWATANPSTATPLSAMFGAAMKEVTENDERLIATNPFSGMVNQHVRRRDIPDDWLPLADLEKIEEAARVLYPDAFGEDCAAMVRFAAETGVRPGELYGVEHADLAVRSGELTIRRAADSLTRTMSTPKNGKARVVVLSTAAAEAALRARHFDGTTRVFSTPRGKQWWTGSWNYYWRSIAIAAGRPGMQFYELRHFCATRLLEADVPDWQVAIQLGHEDGGELVRKTYGHPSRRIARAAIRKALDGSGDAGEQAA